MNKSRVDWVRRWLERLFGRSGSAEVHVQADVHFLGEQDGKVEQEIKARWTQILTNNPSVQRAYLAIVSYGDAATYQPVLCITHCRSDDDLALVDALGEPFREIFKEDQALDIMFLRPEQETLVRRTCKPFYVAG